MTRYAYQAISDSGEPVTGEVVADSEVVALDMLSRRGLIPVALTAGEVQGPWWQREVSLFSRASVLRHEELERIFATLAALLRARLPLPRALAFCEQQSRDRRSRRTLATARETVENGGTLAQGLRDAGEAVPARLIALVASGEASNRLQEVASRTARALGAEAKLGRELRGALIYPAILMAMATLVIAMIMFFLAPTLLPVFVSAGAEAPMVLQVMAGMGDLVKTYWPLVLLGVFALVLLWRAFRVTLTVWAFGLALHLPVIGTHVRRMETLRLTLAMSMMLDSGAPVLRALAAAREAVHHPAFATLLDQAQARLTAGGTLTSVLAPSGLIDPMAMALISAGEESDRLLETLQTASDTLEAQVAAQTAQAIRLLTPILTLVIGSLVASIILTTISAMMDLNDIAF